MRHILNYFEQINKLTEMKNNDEKGREYYDILRNYTISR